MGARRDPPLRAANTCRAPRVGPDADLSTGRPREGVAPPTRPTAPLEGVGRAPANAAAASAAGSPNSDGMVDTEAPPWSRSLISKYLTAANNQRARLSATGSSTKSSSLASMPAAPMLDLVTRPESTAWGNRLKKLQNCPGLSIIDCTACQVRGGKRSPDMSSIWDTMQHTAVATSCTGADTSTWPRNSMRAFTEMSSRAAFISSEIWH
mmetsp:Transcript_36100/g.95889  ORF Transcript_36100/g.95889 Transcript_36100/m.95889 type:complete len:209 (+) Transcript_36100:1196-1822(+)